MRVHVGAAVAVFVFDGLIWGEAAVTALFVLVMVIIGLVKFGIAHEDGDRARARHGLQMVALYLTLAGAVVGANQVNEQIARWQGDRIVAALQVYKARHGRYPGTLEELMPSVPAARYTLFDRQFRYGYDAAEDDGILWYTSRSPFGHAFYRLKAPGWGYMD